MNRREIDDADRLYKTAIRQYRTGLNGLCFYDLYFYSKSLYITPVKPFMNRTKCVIVEDNPNDMELLTHYVSGEPTLELAQTFANAIEALSLVKLLRPPLLFMDIDMPVMNGIDLFKNLDYHPLCIFVTAHSEYALDSYEAQAFDFILKPVTAKRFAQTIIWNIDIIALICISSFRLCRCIHTNYLK